MGKNHRFARHRHHTNSKYRLGRDLLNIVRNGPQIKPDGEIMPGVSDDAEAATRACMFGAR